MRKLDISPNISNLSKKRRRKRISSRRLRKRCTHVEHEQRSAITPSDGIQEAQTQPHAPSMPPAHGGVFPGATVMFPAQGVPQLANQIIETIKYINN
ncbi:hypothetical protein MAR_037872 [Mya arenaria]|uniref:Uncharacterized protein n=1 Tax=Mya arenaria TaxID=6604 RepID=A0ABY7FTQ5_MYAAR|nr:hypothetical protein MAR_037872 [Mya arenaria]